MTIDSTDYTITLKAGDTKDIGDAIKMTADHTVSIKSIEATEKANYVEGSFTWDETADRFTIKFDKAIDDYSQNAFTATNVSLHIEGKTEDGMGLIVSVQGGATDGDKITVDGDKIFSDKATQTGVNIGDVLDITYADADDKWYETEEEADSATGGGGAPSAGTKAKLTVAVVISDDNGPATPAANDTVRFESTGGSIDIDVTFTKQADGSWTTSDTVTGYDTVTFNGSSLVIEQGTASTVGSNPFGTVTATVTISGNTDNPKATLTPSWTNGVAAS